MTGIRGPWPKPTDQRLRRNKRGDAGLIAVDGQRGETPAPNPKWCVQIRKEWFEYWDSPVVQLSSPQSDMSALRRLFDYKHELVWAMTAYRKERITEGSMGQQRISPMFEAVMKLEKVITPLEDRFGMTPAGRLRLGATLGEASQSLSKMNAQLDEEVAGELDDDTADPRDFLDTKTTNQGTKSLQVD